MKNSPTPQQTLNPFDQLGGTLQVEKLARSFYSYMAREEKELAGVHQLDDRGEIKDDAVLRFSAFLHEWLGGPANYSPTYGHPRLRMRHSKVKIDSKMRDAWLRCMSHALDKIGAQGDVRSFLDARFADVANFLRNHPDS